MDFSLAALLPDAGAGSRRAIVSLPVPPLRAVPGWDQYCVTGDGRKFIFLEPVDASKSLTVVLNWTTGPKR